MTENDAIAFEVGLTALAENGGNIPEALYSVYEHFRERYLEEYGLMDVAPGTGRWADALADARTQERLVCRVWADEILK